MFVCSEPWGADGQREAHTRVRARGGSGTKLRRKKRTAAGCASGEPVWIKAVQWRCKKRRIEAEGDVADMNLAMLLRLDCRLTAECL